MTPQVAFAIIFAIAGLDFTSTAEFGSIDAPCATMIPSNLPFHEWGLTNMSAAFLQIFRDQTIQCSGAVAGWRFRLGDISTDIILPKFAIWRKIGKGPRHDFYLVGYNDIDRSELIEEGEGWYRFDVPPTDRIQVDSVLEHFTGLFYPKIALSSELAHVYYYVNTKASYSASTNPQSAVMGDYTESEIMFLTSTNRGILEYNPVRMINDIRIPLVQAVISPFGGELCRQTPEMQHGELLAPPKAILGEKLQYKCYVGYTWNYTHYVDYTCTEIGWLGDGRCQVSSAACYMPFIAGRCTELEMQYYFDLNTKECKWSWYGGCGGNANSFLSWNECMDVCGFMATR